MFQSPGLCARMNQARDNKRAMKQLGFNQEPKRFIHLNIRGLGRDFLFLEILSILDKEMKEDDPESRDSVSDTKQHT